MTHNPLIPIAVGNTAEIHVSDIGNVRLAGYVSASDIPALTAALTTLAREMGADVPDPVPVIEGLLEALESVSGVGHDAPMTWGGNDGEWQARRARIMQDHARKAIPTARAYLEKVKK